MTPMMEQYMSVKEKYPDCILFYRLGDFYEMFYDDALTASRELEIVLTQRDAGQGEKAPMCGVPYHVYETYLSKLVNKGYKVAICEQLENPKMVKGIVKRDIVKIVTPGTIIDSSLEEKQNNFLCSIFLTGNACGLCYIDNSTGELYTSEFNTEDVSQFLLNELGNIAPSEIIINDEGENNLEFQRYIREFMPSVTKKNPLISDPHNVLKEFFSDAEIKSVRTKPYAAFATLSAMEYLKEMQRSEFLHINRINVYEAKHFMKIDYNTKANLELTETLLGRNRKGSLIYVLDQTVTAMGGRLLKKWLEYPLLSDKEINERLDAVELFFHKPMLLDSLRGLLKQIYDLERISSKIYSGSGNARDFSSLRASLKQLPALYAMFQTEKEHRMLDRIFREFDTLNDIYERIEKTIVDDPPLTTTEGGMIRPEFSEELRALHELLNGGKTMLLELETQEKEKTEIRNLKIGFNKVYGYYFEVTNSQREHVPDYFIRRQTLTNCERYFTEELKNLEDSILHAGEKSKKLEYDIFVELREFIKDNIQRIQKVAKSVAMLDVLSSFGKLAMENNYTRPLLNHDGRIEIVDGRHPVVETHLKDTLFIANDTRIGRDGKFFQIITGPNMSGKSTYMRQVALITVLAHIGCFVPAKSADISVTDRIFTRIGASDNLAKGESTFMVEMKEVAQILEYATSSSLVILDEVGRGTGTYDGLSIAWAVVEFMVTQIKAKTLFATHYHELTQLSESHGEIENLTISILEKDSGVVFLRKVVPGATDRSFGIEVAKLAGVHDDVIEKARIILKMIEGSHKIVIKKTDSEKQRDKQLDFNNYRREYVFDSLLNADLDNLSPREAHELVHRLQRECKMIQGV